MKYGKAGLLINRTINRINVDRQLKFMANGGVAVFVLHLFPLVLPTSNCVHYLIPDTLISGSDFCINFFLSCITRLRFRSRAMHLEIKCDRSHWKNLSLWNWFVFAMELRAIQIKSTLFFIYDDFANCIETRICAASSFDSPSDPFAFSNFSNYTKRDQSYARCWVEIKKLGPLCRLWIYTCACRCKKKVINKLYKKQRSRKGMARKTIWRIVRGGRYDWPRMIIHLVIALDWLVMVDSIEFNRIIAPNVKLTATTMSTSSIQTSLSSSNDIACNTHDLLSLYNTWSSRFRGRHFIWIYT